MATRRKAFRTEHDSMGALQVPADALWGAGVGWPAFTAPPSTRQARRRPPPRRERGFTPAEWPKVEGMRRRAFVGTAKQVGEKLREHLETSVLPPFLEPADPPFDGCDSDLVASGAYGLGTLDPSSEEGELHCLHWHLTQECDASGRPLVDVRRPDLSRLLRAPFCASGGCIPNDTSHPEEGFEDKRPGSAWAYLFNWIARGAPAD